MEYPGRRRRRIEQVGALPLKPRLRLVAQLFQELGVQAQQAGPIGLERQASGGGGEGLFESPLLPQRPRPQQISAHRTRTLGITRVPGR